MPSITVNLPNEQIATEARVMAARKGQSLREWAGERIADAVKKALSKSEAKKRK